MPSSGSGTLTPISGGAGVGLSMAQPLPYTLLALSRYAKIMGINPVHFAGAVGGNIFPSTGACNDIWHKYSWQSGDRVSLEDLATAIQDAEREVAAIVGYYAAPIWIEEEEVPYPRTYLREAFGTGINVRGIAKSVHAKHGKILAAGVRAVTAIGTATTVGGSLAYTDEDGDGFFETATVSFATTQTDACAVKVYMSGMNGDLEWEIRNPRSKTISGGIYTAIFDSWLFVNPELYEAYPTQYEPEAIDLSSTANFVTTVDIYYEYTDNTQASVAFYWGDAGTCSICGGVGCEACGYDVDYGCFFIRSALTGEISPTAADYSATDGQWNSTAWPQLKDPDKLKLWYRAGDVSNEYLAGRTCDPLSVFWAKTIALFATARLERPFCSCANLLNLQADLRTDLAVSPTGLGRFVTDDVFHCPFGTLKGEVMAWRRIKYLLRDKKPSYATI